MKDSESRHELWEKCAVFGLYSPGSEAARVAFYGLWALQHRGQEGSGIVTSDGYEMFRHAGAGLASSVYRDQDMQRLKGHIAIGHNRYATSGGTGDIYNQPFLHDEGHFALAHNGNLPDCAKLENFLAGHHIPTESHNDTRLMEAAIAHYVSRGHDLPSAIVKAYPLFTGVFSAVSMDAKRLVAFRDVCGIRPLSIGLLDEGHVVASETCAFDTIGATFLREVRPGEMVVIDDSGLTSHQVVRGNQKIDVFEFVYFARPDSVIMGQRVNNVRQNLGHEMAKESSLDADVVIPVPDSAIPAALGYSRSSGIPFDIGIIKNRYIHRTFIQPTAGLRQRDVKMKLNPILESVAGKRVILVDDSVVRGTTMRQVVQIVRDAGATQVHLMISSPPVLYPDFYGINTPDQKDLIAAHMSLGEMRDYLGADTLNFLSIDGMVRATGLSRDQLSLSCFDGVYPIPIGRRRESVTGVSALGVRAVDTPMAQVTRAESQPSRLPV
ncbi:MAG: amidophosphoribosyltransferase [Acidimicrobiales bacterium]|jgi:amidophosphoribosyltransferase